MTAIEDIAAERDRQKSVEGWTLEHDDEHMDGSLAEVAACYATTHLPLKTVAEHVDVSGGRGDCPCWSIKRFRVPKLWPKSWAPQWWNPKDRRRNLVRAGALIVAEIERLDRAEQRKAA